MDSIPKTPSAIHTESVMRPRGGLLWNFALRLPARSVCVCGTSSVHALNHLNMATAAPSEATSAAPLLVPYRAVGLVSDGVPFAVAQLGNETFVTTAVGRSFQVFSEKKLRLSFSGPQLPRAVTALCAAGEVTVVASGASAHVYRRAERIALLEGEHAAPLKHLLMLGESTLLTICEAGTLVVWSLPSGEVARRLHTGFAPTSVYHPATYLNKVLVGAADGRLQLLNLRSGACVHEFAGWGSAVLCLEQSPALDVVGVGHASGRIVLHNLKFDRTILTLYHDEADACTALAFRTDGPSVLVSASARGALHVWDLEKRRRLTSIPDAHGGGGVASAHFVRGQSTLLTLGASDNAVKAWAFDRPDGGARLLRSRSGHSAPPTRVSFHADALLAGGGPAGQAYLLSGGADRTVRQASVWSAQQDAEFSQKREEKKHSMHAGEEERRLPPLVDLVSSQARERDWANVLTCHADSPHAYTWDTTRKALGQHTLSLTAPCAITAVAISPCGNFGYLGGERGAVEKFNLQSGQRRASTSALAAAQQHSGAVRGLAPDPLARCVFSGGFDATLRTWQPRDLKPAGCLDAGAPVSMLRHHRDSTLLAAVCDDICIRLFDMVVGRLVRVLTGHTNTITDAAWSSDGRWLLSASLDSTLRIVDVPSGTTIGWYTLDDPPTSIAVSPQGEYVATAHASTVSLCVWANRAFFESALISPAGDAPTKLEMPVAAAAGEEDGSDDEGDGDSDGDGGMAESGDDDDDDDDDEEAAAKQALERAAVAQIGECITLSSLPSAHIRTLVHLDTIQQRNLPVQPPTAPKSAPFFLPTTEGVVREFAPLPAEADGKAPTAAAEAAFNGGGDAAADDDDEWAAAAAAAGDDANDDDVLLLDTMDVAPDGEGGDGDELPPSSKRARRSRMLSSHGQASLFLSELQKRVRACASSLRDAGTASKASGAAGGRAGGKANGKASAGKASAGKAGAKAGAKTAGGAAGAVDAVEEVTTYVLSLTPSALDLELRTLGGASGEDGEDDLDSALRYFAAALGHGREYEVLQAALCVFLRLHHEAIATSPRVAETLKGLQDVQHASWEQLKNALHNNLCLLSHMCRTQS